MSISSEISRIQTAKAAIKTSIENKGVTVPSGTHIDGYSTLIDQISGGGSAMPSNLSAWTYDANGNLKSAVYTASTMSANAYDASSISAITITNITSIPNYAFQNSKIQNINIQSNVTSVGQYAFNSCQNLEDLKGLSGITTFNTNLFNNCNYLRSVDLGVISSFSGSGQFNNCFRLLSEINISNSVVTIPSSFSSCYSLPYFEVPSGVTTLQTNATSNLYGLSYLKFEGTTPPNASSTNNLWGNSECPIIVPSGTSATYKAANYFNNGDMTARIVEEGWSPSYSNFKCELRYSGANTVYIEQLTSDETTITSADSRTRNYQQLKRVYIGDQVTEIGNRAFNGCNQCGFVGFSKNNTSLKTIGEYAFYSLFSNYYGVFVIPIGVTSIGNNAFNQGRCYVLKPTTPPTLGGNRAFGTVGKGYRFYVPTESLDAYKTATNWSYYKDYMFPMSELPFDLNKYEL